MMFPIRLSYILELRVRCQFASLFSKDFKTYILFVDAVTLKNLFLKIKIEFQTFNERLRHFLDKVCDESKRKM